jgi:hypothetical protein
MYSNKVIAVSSSNVSLSSSISHIRQLLQPAMKLSLIIRLAKLPNWHCIANSFSTFTKLLYWSSGDCFVLINIVIFLLLKYSSKLPFAHS